MTVCAPLPPATPATASQLLDIAVAAISAGDAQDGADLVYQAARRAVAGAAARHGIKCETDQDINDFLHRMDCIPLPPDGHDVSQTTRHYRHHLNGRATRYLSRFRVAQSYQEHAATPQASQLAEPNRYWGPDEYLMFIPPVRELIEWLEQEPLPEVPQ